MHTKAFEIYQNFEYFSEGQHPKPAAHSEWPIEKYGEVCVCKQADK